MCNTSPTRAPIFRLNLTLFRGIARLTPVLLFLSVTFSVSLCRGDDRNRIQEALHRLNQIPQGQLLLSHATQVWKVHHFRELQSYIQLGQASRTDTVLTRHYNPKSGKEERERQITISLREAQTESELLLDLAHELVHATARPAFDPYDSHLTLGKYVKTAIEGEGGEVDAFVGECGVGLEFFSRAHSHLGMQEGVQASIRRCLPYLSEVSLKGIRGINREKVRKAFYRVGKRYDFLVKNFGSEIPLFPNLSRNSPEFYSSTGHTPYPAALMEEYKEITAITCANSRNRLGVSGNFAFPFFKSLRIQSALANGAGDSSQEEVERFIAKRCQ